MIKSYFKDFSPENLIDPEDDFEELVNNRQEGFYNTVEYAEIKEKIEYLLDRIKELLPGDEAIIGFNGLHDNISDLECICYSAAYRAGMADLMAALTLNKLEITKTEYLVLPGKEKSIPHDKKKTRVVLG